jgi:sterol-4alpha-carboxylate 3-dehydrogenase (decarboxylating)
MALTHNTIFRGLNAVYHQAPGVLPGTQEATDLLFYCSVAWDFIHSHHVIEESIYFPKIEEATGVPGLMSDNVEQHRQLEAGLERLRKYAQETRKEDYDAEKLRAIIEDLAGPLETHLHEEIPTIINLHDKIDSKTIKEIYGHMHDAAERTSDGFK